MSALVISGDTSGSVTLQAPAVAGSTVLTLQGTSGLVVAPATAGTTGQLLQSNGSSAPTWVAAPTSGLTFIASQTVTTSVASVDFTTGIDSTYDNYQIVFSNFSVSAGAGRIRIRLYSGGAFATSYTTLGSWGTTGNATGSDVFINNAHIGNNNGGTPNTNTVWSGNLILGSVNTSTSYSVAVNGVIIGASSTAAASVSITTGGTKNTSGVVTGFQIYFSTGDVVSGTATLYGMSKS